jgi:UDP-glucose 6-dehydrogenase
MRVCVLGLWHLSCLTAGCLARAGHDVLVIDPDSGLIERLQPGEPPILEPGLADLIGEALTAGRLQFAADAPDALAHANVV